LDLTDQRRNGNDAKASAAFVRGPVRGISAARARDMCEMSMSLDASKGWGVHTEDMGASRTINNPFMSSGNVLLQGINNLEAAPKNLHSRATFAMKEDDEEYEEDFEHYEDVQPMELDRWENKRTSGNSQNNNRGYKK
jgi:hypothetical protein